MPAHRLFMCPALFLQYTTYVSLQSIQQLVLLKEAQYSLRRTKWNFMFNVYRSTSVFIVFIMYIVIIIIIISVYYCPRPCSSKCRNQFLKSANFRVSIMANIKTMVVWDVMTCSMVFFSKILLGWLDPSWWRYYLPAAHREKHTKRQSVRSEKTWILKKKYIYIYIYIYI